MSDVIKFITGKKYNNMNWKGLTVLLILVTPTFILDLVCVRLVLTGKPWNDLVSGVNISPSFGLWIFFSVACSGIMMAILIFSLRNNKNSRISENDDPLKKSNRT